MTSLQNAKNQAHTLKKYLKETNNEISHASCLHAIAKINGFENWNTMHSIIERKEQYPEKTQLLVNHPKIQINSSVFTVIKNGGRDGKLGGDTVLMLSYILDRLTDNSLIVFGFSRKRMSLWENWSQERFEKALAQLQEVRFIDFTYINEKLIIVINPFHFWKGSSEKHPDAIDLFDMSIYLSLELIPQVKQIDINKTDIILFAEDMKNQKWREQAFSILKQNHTDLEVSVLIDELVESIFVENKYSDNLTLVNKLRGKKPQYKSDAECDTEILIFAEKNNNKMRFSGETHVVLDVKPFVNINEHPKFLEVQKFLQEQKPVLDPRIYVVKIKEILGTDYYVGYGGCHIHINSLDQQNELACIANKKFLSHSDLF